MNNKKIILSLCDYSGAWSKPYVDAGYRVIMVDLSHPPGLETQGKAWTIGADVRKLAITWPIYGVLAAPPCDCFCRPAARWWKRQDAEGKTKNNVEIFRACMRLAKLASAFWAIENPPGRHASLMPELGPRAWQWQPFHFGHPWHKQTYIWGNARQPEPSRIVAVPPRYRTPNGKSQGRLSMMSSSCKREREKTPGGFARAFFKVNQ